MRNPERAEQPELDPYIEARRALSVAQRTHQSFADRNYSSGVLRRGLSRILIKSGRVNIAERIAPELVAEIRYREEKRRKDIEKKRTQRGYYRAATGDALRAAYDTTIPNPFPEGNYKPNPFRETTREIESDREIELNEGVEENFMVPAETSPEEAFIKTQEVEIPAGPEAPHWTYWYADKAQDETPETQDNPKLFFDEEKRKVGLLRATQVVPLTNVDLADFINQEAKRIMKGGYTKLVPDLETIVCFIIENPIGAHSELIKTRKGLKKLDPRKIPGAKYTNPLTKHLRVIYAYDDNTIVFFGILKHEEQARKFKGGRKE